MIKTYKSIKDYAETKWICSKTASKKIKNWLVEVFEVPKGAKYYEIDKEAIISEYIKNLEK